MHSSKMFDRSAKVMSLLVQWVGVLIVDQVHAAKTAPGQRVILENFPSDLPKVYSSFQSCVHYLLAKVQIERFPGEYGLNSELYR